MESDFFTCIVWEYYLYVCGIFCDGVNCLNYVASMVDKYECRALVKRSLDGGNGQFHSSVVPNSPAPPPPT
jgi:hypothetical protein